MNSITLLKIGGSVITDKEKDKPSPDLESMERVADEIVQGIGDDELVLMHGAGSYGHPIVNRTGIHKGIETEDDKLNFAKAQRLQNELNSIFTEVLIEKGLPAYPVQASASAVMNGELEKMNTDVVDNLVDMGMVPVLYGVPAYDRTKGCSILSGDEIMSYLTKELGVRTVLQGTNVDGVYTSDPREDPDAELIDSVSSMEEVKKYVGESKDTDVTGGMLGKIEEILDLNVSGRIFNASEPGNVERVLGGENIGTLIKNE